MPVKTCLQCVEQYSARTSKQKYCSDECYRASYRVTPVECPTCLVIFERKESRQIYCSRSCAVTVNNAKYPKRIRTTKCSEPVCEEKITFGRKFCEDHRNLLGRSTQYWDSIYEDKIQSWLNNENTGSKNSGELARWARKYLLDQANHRCSRCGWCEPNPILERPILTVDHIDGNWKNNKIDNLQVLCYNCHTLTENFGSLNKKSAGIRGSGNRAYPEHSISRKEQEKQAPLG